MVGVPERIFSLISGVDTFNKDSLKQLFPGLHEREFGLSFTEAIDRCRRDLGRVYSPQSTSEASLYVLANAEQRLNRGQQQIQAANRKMVRAVETIAIRCPRQNVALERRRGRMLERASFQLARRAIPGPEEFFPSTEPRLRQTQRPVQEQIVDYPSVAPRVRNRSR